ncbi:MAG: hypothetical protein RBR02_06340 [Desulfuromonadaceae bacterium]|nr:hypothetical protein [Desulfuromonadaceae bacterium]
MEYKNKFNGIIYDTEKEVFVVARNSNLQRPRVQKVYPKIKDNPTALKEIPEDATEEEVQALESENEQITLSNIEYIVREYE